MSVNKRNVNKDKSKFALRQNKKMMKQSAFANVSQIKSPKRKAKLKRRRTKKKLLSQQNNKVALNSTQANLDKRKSL